MSRAGSAVVAGLRTRPGALSGARGTFAARELREARGTAALRTLYGVVRGPGSACLRRVVKRVICRLEGGEMRSATLRRIMQRHHGVEAGAGERKAKSIGLEDETTLLQSVSAELAPRTGQHFVGEIAAQDRPAPAASGQRQCRLDSARVTAATDSTAVRNDASTARFGSSPAAPAS